MERRTCQHCAYAGRVHNGDPGELICVNCPVALGEPVRVQPDGICENFRATREPPLRLPPPESPSDQVCFIPLTKGQFAMVDAVDYPELSKYKWMALSIGNNIYAVRNKKGKTAYMHREIMQPPPGMVTDHIDRNGRNNCRSNLRNCTRKENLWNSRSPGNASGFKGVWYNRKRRLYEAGLYRDGKKVYLGSFNDPVEAARVRDEKAADVHGRYAFINLPELLTPRPVPPDPNHPERPITFTGRYAYLRCPPCLPPLPDGSRPAGRGTGGVSRIVRLAGRALNCRETAGATRGSRQGRCPGGWLAGRRRVSWFHT